MTDKKTISVKVPMNEIEVKKREKEIKDKLENTGAYKIWKRLELDALAGDNAAAKFILEKSLTYEDKSLPIRIKTKRVQSARDVLELGEEIIQRVLARKISPEEGKTILEMLAKQRDSIEFNTILDIEKSMLN